MENFLSRIENVFRNSSSSDELFDAFREALNTHITDIDVYKVLLGNPALSTDEIKMYAEKLAKEIPQQTAKTFMWTAQVFEHHKDDYEKLEDSVKYYQKSFEHDSTNSLSLIHLLGLYNFDLETEINITIMKFVDSRVVSVHNKSSVYFALADIYKKKEDYSFAAKYLALGEKAAERENN